MSHLIQSGFSDCTQLLVETFSGKILISDFSFTKKVIAWKCSITSTTVAMDWIILTGTTCITAQLLIF